MLSLISKIIAPHSCIFCNTEGRTVCDGCFSQHITLRTQACVWCNRLDDTGRTCRSCRRHTPLLRLTTLLRLDEASERLIYALKYHGNREIATLLGRRLAQQIPDGVELITFVSSDGPALRRRGYNQAELIARAVSDELGVPIRPTLLRLRHAPQVGQSRHRRIEQTKGNFMIRSGALAGRRICIIDDVVTTGATLSECARVLKAAGARSVSAAALARK